MICREFLNGKVTLYPGDCIDVLARLPENSVDSVVTDPPYHLTSIVKRFGAEGAAPAKAGATGAYQRASSGFMGKVWDGGDIAFQPATWAAVLRVLKPGGHMVAFSGTRTYHRMVCAIEDAGFEIRDQIGWAFGSGFPKSHDVSKGIDKKRDDRADVLRVTKFMADAAEAAGLSKSDVDEHMGTSDMGGWWLSRLQHRCQCPKWDQWLQLKAFLSLSDEMDAEVARLNGRKGEFGEGWQARSTTGEFEEWTDRTNYALTSRDGLRRDNPSSDAAIKWQGWGTALKPAWEPICLARKPISEKSIAANVLQHGTGAINIDACRVDAADGVPRFTHRGEDSINCYGDGKNGSNRTGEIDTATGRWPANLIHDGSDEVLAGFPESKDGVAGARTGTSTIAAVGLGALDSEWGGYGSEGSAARFFASFPPKDEFECTPRNASFAEPTFSLKSEHAVSALSNAVAQSMPGRALISASYRAPSTTVTGRELSRLCESVTTAIQSIGKRFSLESLPEKLTLSDSLAGIVVEQGQIDIIETTISLWKSYGSADPVTFNITATNAELGAQDSRRLFYSSKADAADRLGSRHPTVKPLDLMQYLCRLVTPPGGTVLDPFAGTGTTGEAAWREGFKAILIEREAEYQADIARRMDLVLKPTKRAAVAKTKNNLMGAEGTPLFGDVA